MTNLRHYTRRQHTAHFEGLDRRVQERRQALTETKARMVKARLGLLALSICSVCSYIVFVTLLWSN